MTKIIILLAMIFLHIVDDYYLQGILAQLKQKSWWDAHAPDELYKRDYIIALIEHAFSWTFMMMLPIMVAWYSGVITVDAPDFIVAFIINCGVHAIVDHQKANKRTINLTQDQLIHIFFILLTAFHFLILHN